MLSHLLSCLRPDFPHIKNFQLFVISPFHYVVQWLHLFLPLSTHVGHCLCSDSNCFTNASLESIPSTTLNGSLRNFNTWRVSVGNRTLRRDFVSIAPQKYWDPKTTYFRRLRTSMTTLRANVSGEVHDIDNREPALITAKGPVR